VPVSKYSDSSAAADAASNDLTPARITVPGASVQVKNQKSKTKTEPHQQLLTAVFSAEFSAATILANSFPYLRI